MRIACGMVIACLLAVGLVAQEKAPALDETSRLLVENVVLSAQLEQAALDALKLTDAYKKYEAAQKARQSAQAANLAKVEKQYPGFTVDWAKRVLIVKPPQQAKQ
jgi:hypothetical protein